MVSESGTSFSLQARSYTETARTCIKLLTYESHLLRKRFSNWNECIRLGYACQAWSMVFSKSSESPPISTNPREFKNNSRRHLHLPDTARHDSPRSEAKRSGRDCVAHTCPGRKCRGVPGRYTKDVFWLFSLCAPSSPWWLKK